MARTFVEDDFVAVHAARDSKARRVVTLAFGDEVEILSQDTKWTEVRVLTHFDGRATGFVKGKLPTRAQGVLKFSMVDVQQGDGLVLESPEGKVVLVDGGDNKLFARHVAERFRHRGSTPEAPLEVDAVVVTHGDADHFAGLSEIRRSEGLTGAKARKRLFLHPKRVFHNGLVKGPSKDAQGKGVPDAQMLGRTVLDAEGWPSVVDLYEDFRTAPPEAMNTPFREWVETLRHWSAGGRPISCERLALGMDGASKFDFLAQEGVQVDILGPVAETVRDASGSDVPALPFLPEPEKSAEMHLEAPSGRTGAPSASHTINGHSIALRVTYGDVRFQLTGDLNRDSMDLLRRTLPAEALEAEIVKVPHHGSHEFDFAALEATRPVVAIISSGDEQAGKEYIHPRATLMAASGKVMRGKTGLVFCTELAAFFEMRGLSYRQSEILSFLRANKDESFRAADLLAAFSGEAPAGAGPAGTAGAFEGFPRPFFGFERTNFGIIHVRTDGRRVLVFTHSGKANLNEAYRFSVTRDPQGRRRVVFAKRVSTR